MVVEDVNEKTVHIFDGGPVIIIVSVFSVNNTMARPVHQTHPHADTLAGVLPLGPTLQQWPLETEDDGTSARSTASQN